jgi:FAD/FMN-containing dehydrogenase
VLRSTLARSREARLTKKTAVRSLLDALEREAGAGAIDRRLSERRAFAVDASGSRSGREPALPLAVVRPATAGAAARVLAFASREELPVVPWGGGTGLMGGALSAARGLVLDLCRLSDIDVRPGDRLVWAGAGAVLAEVDAALRLHGLQLGHDPWTFSIATVGGAISTNGLGYKGGRYGGMGDQVLAVEVALADGTIFRTRAVSRRSTGPDLARLFAGAEGTLGVVTAAALRAYARPEAERRACYEFESFEAGFAVVDELAALGLRPALLDYGEEHATPWSDLSLRREGPAVLYLGFEGFREEVEAAAARADSVAARLGGQAQPAERAEELWATRHVAAERFLRGKGRRRRARRGSAGLVFDYLHVALPPSRVLAFRDVCHEWALGREVALVECGLWTAPDLFSAVFIAREGEGARGAMTGVIAGLLREAQALGGSMEYCHGAGLRLAHLMEEEHGAGLEVLRRLKRALDPSGVLNAGKLGL